MNGNFNLLATAIVRSTVWGYSDGVRIVWVTILALKDKRGYVWTSIPGLAHEARVSIETVREALDIFTSPDPDSGNKDCDGRRIELVEGGLRVISHDLYRLERDPEARTEQNRAAQKRWRDKHRKPNKPESANISPSLSDPILSDPSNNHTTTLPPKVGATAKPPAAARRMEGPEGEVLRAFDVGHRKALGAPYMAAFARDVKTLKQPLKVYGLPLMLEFVDAFWQESEKAERHPEDAHFAAGRAKPHIPGLVGQIPNLLRRYTFQSKAPNMNGGPDVP